MCLLEMDASIYDLLVLVINFTQWDPSVALNICSGQFVDEYWVHILLRFPLKGFFGFCCRV